MVHMGNLVPQYRQTVLMDRNRIDTTVLEPRQRTGSQKDIHYEMVYQLTQTKEKWGWRDSMHFYTNSVKNLDCIVVLITKQDKIDNCVANSFHGNFKLQIT